MGHLDTVLAMAKKGQVPGAPMQFNFVLGVPGCTPATVPNLCWLVNAIPAGSTWTATGIGRHAFTLAAPGKRCTGEIQWRISSKSSSYRQRIRPSDRYLRGSKRDFRIKTVKIIDL